MPDLLKEFRESVVDGVRRLIEVDQNNKAITLPLTGKRIGTGIQFEGTLGTHDDNRITTGLDPTTGLTTVAFVVGVSEVGGVDVWSM